MKIFVQGFKSLRDGQYIALGNKLTFLVGPNSAGKSTLKLVLDKLKGDSPNFELDTKLIYRNPNQSNQMASFHSIGLEWHCKDRKFEYIYQYELEDKLAPISSKYGVNFLENNLLFEYGGEDIESDPQELSFSKRTFITGTAGVIRIEEDENFIFKYLHTGKWPDFREIYIIPENYIKSNNLKFKQLLIECVQWQIEQANSIKNECPAIYDLINNASKLWPFFWIGFTLKKAISEHFKSKILQQKLNHFERYKAVIDKYVYKSLKFISSNYPGEELSATLVSAKRTLPNDCELSWLQQPIILSRSKSSKEFRERFHELKKSPETLSSYQALMSSKKLLSKVNQALAESMFTDNGYQIRVDSKTLVSDRDWELRATNVKYELFKPPKYHIISLQDSHGRYLSFEDVGSGIGYVLPVLIEAFRESNQKKVVFLQQPELHLHPALQANLTDVLIEASANKRIVAETHSEHLLLRALKRVRQTSNNTLKDPNLKLTPEDIAVNYFEPLPDGSTIVHIIRVSEEGDFLDRWPNGFFAERDQELFDE